MKSYLKRALSLLLAITLLFMCAPLSAEAAKSAKGTTSKNPANLGTKGSYTATWKTNTGYRYMKFKMKKQGYATITATKPYNKYRKKYHPLYLFIYNSKGKKVWDCRTDGQSRLKTKNYSYKVGLKKGTYQLVVKAFYEPPIGTLKSKITVKTTASKYWETEFNDSFETATPIDVGKTYNGVYGENIAGSDYYQVFLLKGFSYKIKVGGYKDLFTGTTICDVFYPNKSSQLKMLNSYNKAGYAIKYIGYSVVYIQESGYYYIRIRNNNGSKTPGRKYTLSLEYIF